MNTELLKKFQLEAGGSFYPGINPKMQERFAELLVHEFIALIETEIGLVQGYKNTAANEFDVRWHDGKIAHFHKLLDKTKKHFGV